VGWETTSAPRWSVRVTALAVAERSAARGVVRISIEQRESREVLTAFSFLVAGARLRWSSSVHFQHSRIEEKTMKKLLLSCIAIGSLLGFSACGVEEVSESEESVETQEVSAPIEVAAGGHWRLLELRSCFADFSRPCNSTVPSNQCPTGTQIGSACPSLYVTCNRVLAGTGYQILQCQ
jgi:hypothetical protein